jgi:GxxExxY protein
MSHSVDREGLNAISLAIVQSAIDIHRTLGPGLLESIHRSCMVYELRERGLSFNVPALVSGLTRIVNRF